ncbi:hypothetical protein Pla108_19870 [Botrimarina colliarenosi]|uniref:Metal-independent alpha-mannosidase n=1 Tax=Botrimarina colliarenosi TaxID=2528001 RepID=A0A5C6ACY7_9BACT|nr:glycoside hydrolase family 125 protein [Botrimarina colliarenosi]TWT97834.1 hypothetical protein Pla108_19870 [Botrimarina colliarenosi]
MTNRILAGALATLTSISAMAADFQSKRPPVDERCFTSESVEQTIATVKPIIADPELAWMFENCYPNTLDTTVDYEVLYGKPDTFVITGDIDAMWLRDSTAQVWPYLRYVNEDEALRKLVEGLVRRQTKCVLLDPYANAFYKDLTKESEWASDRPAPIDGVHERKWEIDSLCYTVRLANEYYRLTGEKSIFDSDWTKAARSIVQTFRTEQRKDGTPYRFTRKTNQMIDAPLFNGIGRPVKPVGLIASAFRPSDDSTLYPFLVPSNLFAVRSLRQLETIFRDVVGDEAFAAECAAFADEVQAAIDEYAVVEHLDFGKIYAYEVDGFGNRAHWDDANVPSLMSLAYLGVHRKGDPLYLRTRKFLLSENNPYYFRGTAAEGQASPHSGPARIWPMGIILRAMTSTSDDEILQCLRMLRATHAGTGLMHEAFNKDDPSDYTRDWFAWANTLFGELVVLVADERPHLLKTKFE